MSFLINTLIRSFLTQQAIGLVQREVTTQLERELRIRQEAAEQAASIRGGRSCVVDFAILFSRTQEAVGLLDRFPDAALTRGNGNSFYTFVAAGKHVVAVVPGNDRGVSLEQAAHAMIDIFRPLRVVTAGFAAGIAPGASLLSVYVPNVLIDETHDRTIDLRQMQLAAPQCDAAETIDLTTSGFETDDAKKPGRFDNKAANNSVTNDSATDSSSESPFSFRVGTIVTTQRSLVTVAKKRELREKFSAQIADQSAFPILNVCQCRQVPVLPLRVVTSLYNEELPRDVGTHSTGTHPARRFGSLLGNFVRRPGSAIDTIKQKQRHLEASDQLARQLIKLLTY
jgi:Nucleoside phosphorylase